MAQLPVRRRVAERVLDGASFRRECHVGLAFDRFAPVDDGGPEVKRDFFERMVGLSRSHKDGEGGRLVAAAHQRHLARLEALRSMGWEVRTLDLIAESRVVTGLGISHPFEAGFAFSPTLGIPVIAGSAIKGLARAYAAEEGWAESLVSKLFGPELVAEDGGASGADPALGIAQFADLTWRQWGELEVDIVNPHYGAYYSGGAAVPGEWMQPVPSFFLTASAGGKWHTAVLVPPLDDDEQLALMECDESLETLAAVADRLHEVLLGAIADLGAGGKTAVGYGMFKEDPHP